MNTGKIYHDSEGNECSIWQVVRREPEWAANRIQAGEDAIKDLEEAKEILKSMKKTETEITFTPDELDNLIRLVYKEGISDGNVMSITGDFDWVGRDREAADWWDRNRDEFLA